jgi:para-aminobenzoate synthetase
VRRVLPLSAKCDPLAAILALRRRGPVVALETTRPSDDHGRRTIVAGAPLAAFAWRRGRGSLEVLRRDPASERLRAVDLAAPTPFHALERLVEALRDGRATKETRSDDEAPPIGAFGWFGYECLAPAELPRLEPFPDAWFLLTDAVVHWSGPEATPVVACDDAALAAEIVRETDAARPAAEGLAARATRRSSAADSGAGDGDLTLADYGAAFHSIRGALERGDSYQLCFTYPLRRPFEGDPLALHARLRRENPAPFAAFVEAPFGAIVSSSPERFLKVGRTGRIEARPMKGTAALSSDPEERERASRELVTSEKTRAENLMIADLLRNDLGRVARLGSVRASRPALLEEHATVLQLVSVIEGELDRGCTRADLLAAAFPPGSMTGAPKVRSIELLRELERAPRGPYSGALGYLATDGRMDLSVVIRAALLAGGEARVNVGGGIVWDSRADAEFAESRLKAAPLLRALAAGAESDGA